MRILAIDQGTTSTKAVLVGETGESELVGSIKHRQILPHPGWVEHDAEELLTNVSLLLEEGVKRGATGVALANQGETIITWDRRTGRPVANAIVWQDQRTAEAVAALERKGHAKRALELSGLPLDPYFSASKLRWILDNSSGVANLARQGRLGLGTSDSYFIERLAGRYATDLTTASRTSLMNLGTCHWDAKLCDLFGVPVELLPEISADGEPIGIVKTAAGKAPLLASAVDQIAALYGHGCRLAGEGKVTVGTGAFALALTGHSRPDNRAGIVPTAAWQTSQGRLYAVDGGVYRAGAAVEWLLRIGLLSDLSELETLTPPSAAERSVFFVPALSGLACPHWDRSASGLFIGMDNATSREDLIKAVLEGVAFRVAEVLEALGFAEAGKPISLDGGLTRSPCFMRFLSDVSGRHLLGRGDAEVTALGAAALAFGVALGRDPGSFQLPFGDFSGFAPSEDGKKLRHGGTVSPKRAGGRPGGVSEGTWIAAGRSRS
jgi:glycerol kinase